MGGNRPNPLWQRPPNSRIEALESLESYFNDYESYMDNMTSSDYFYNLNNLLRNAYVRQYPDLTEDFLVKQPRPDCKPGATPSVVHLDALIERVRRANKDTGMPLISSEMAEIIGQLSVLRQASVSNNTPLSPTRVQALFVMLENDNHRYQNRPCATCREISSAIGIEFGCNRVILRNTKKGEP